MSKAKSEKKRVVKDDESDTEEVKTPQKKTIKKSVKKTTKKAKKAKIYDGLKKLIFEFVESDPSDESWDEFLPKLKKEFKKAMNKDEKKKKEKDPNAPKRGVSGYIVFGQEMRPKLKKKNPDMKPTEIMKEISLLWADIKETKKADKYKKIALEDKKRYEKEMKEYTPTPGFEKEEKVRKRATSAYQFWTKDNRAGMKKKYPDATNGQLMKHLGDKWKKLSEEKKEPYEEMAQKAKIEFAKTHPKSEKKKVNKKVEKDESESSDSESDDE